MEAGIGLELVAETAIVLTPCRYLVLEVSFDHRRAPEWDSSDVYQLDGLVLGGRRVGATGRRRIYRPSLLPLGLGVTEAAPATPVPLPEYFMRTRVKIRTDLFLNPGDLVAGLAARWVDSRGRTLLTAPLRRPDVRIEWPGRGVFVLDLSRQVDQLEERLTRL